MHRVIPVQAPITRRHTHADTHTRGLSSAARYSAARFSFSAQLQRSPQLTPFDTDRHRQTDTNTHTHTTHRHTQAHTHTHTPCARHHPSRTPQGENDQDAGGSDELEAAKSAIAEAQGIFG